MPERDTRIFVPVSEGPLCRVLVDHCAGKWWTTVPGRGGPMCREKVYYCDEDRWAVMPGSE